MDNSRFKCEIQELIERHTEGVYWDFKQQWHNNNVDLLHDIICMANSPANRDCYIILGVEDRTYKVIGVGSENRKNQQNVIDLLSRKPKWAGGYIPEVYIKTILILEQEIDVIIIKQSNNTPFYLLEDYIIKNKSILKGAIYTRKGDTNTPKNSTADLYDTEILWKRRLGLLYNPSQRAQFYLKDLENWKSVDNESDKYGIRDSFFYYMLDPDYTIHFTDDYDVEVSEVNNRISGINDKNIGSPFYYLFAFCNVSYHTDFSDSEKVVLYYKDIPLFSSSIESIDEGRTQIIPPENYWNPYYIKDSLRYLMFEFVFMYCCGSYSKEAKEMILRVIPVYRDDGEFYEFRNYIQDKGYSYEKIRSQMFGEILEKFNAINIENYKIYENSYETEDIAEELKRNKNLVINFASPDNEHLEEITRCLKMGKMLVDWLCDWRNGIL
ncbi:MAG: ATP-binding protein [Lachnospiraceae bacterium]|nr:ATP-binding protein [Lachnospiraceae bacterium]